MPAGGGGDVSVCARSPFLAALAAPVAPGSARGPGARAWCSVTFVAFRPGTSAQGEAFPGHRQSRPVCRARRSLLPGLEPDLGPGSAPSLNSGWPCAFLPHRPVLLPQLSRHKTPAGGIYQLLTAKKVCQCQASRAPSPFLLNKRGEERSGGGFLFG